MLASDDLVPLLDAGTRAAQQGLFEFHRETPRETGRALHLAAFAGVCVGLHHAARCETAVADLHRRVESALRALGAAHDARPVVYARRSLLDVLRRPADESATGPPVRDLLAESAAVPGVASLRPGARAEYAVGRYRRYADAVALFSCCADAPGTWDARGRPFALERALYADLYAAPVAFTAARDVFALVLDALHARETPGVAGPGHAQRGAAGAAQNTRTMSRSLR